LQQALRDSGIRREDLDRLGVRIAKFGMTFPLEPQFTREFAKGLKTILVIEEKRRFLELQLRDLLYNAPDRPQILGKQNEAGYPLLRSEAELDPEDIVKACAASFSWFEERTAQRLSLIAEIEARVKETPDARAPNFCSGCPHNRSTFLLEGQVAGGG